MLRCIQTIEVAKEIFVRMTAQFSFCFVCDSQLHYCIELQRLNGAVGGSKIRGPTGNFSGQLNFYPGNLNTTL